MAFKPVRFDSGKQVLLPMTASTTLTRHQLCKMSSGYLVAGAAGDNEVQYLVMETKTSGASDGELCLVLPISDDMEFDALCSTTPVQATHVGNDYDLTDAATVDLGNTTDKVFHVDSIKDATNSIVRGRFNKPALA